MVLHCKFINLEGEAGQTSTDMILEVGKETFVRMIKRERVFPVVSGNFMESLDDILIMNFDGQFAAVVKTAGSQV
jgi:hypothetical protein